MKISSVIAPWAREKGLLILELRDSSLSLLYSQGEAAPAFEKILLREIPESQIRGRIREFVKKRPFSGACLVIPRADVLQKELQIPVGNRRRETLEQKIREVFPYDSREMAYGIALNDREEAGMLLAVPEKQVTAKLDFLKKLDLEIEEIITEDQAVAWLLEEEKNGTVLGLEQNEDRFLAIMIRQGNLIFSRSFRKEAETDFFEELSLALIELGQKPDRIILMGGWSRETKSTVQEHFRTVTDFHGGAAGEASLPAYGARLFRQRPLISLLPHERKINNWLTERRKALKDIALGLALFTCAVIFAFTAHGSAQSLQLAKLEREAAKLAPEVRELKKTLSFLNLQRDMRASKAEILRLLQDLNSSMPVSIQPAEVRVEGGNFYFKGEASSHASVTQSVQTLERIRGLTGIKLENTRLRKKINQDFYEFEITGKWTS